MEFVKQYFKPRFIILYAMAIVEILLVSLEKCGAYNKFALQLPIILSLLVVIYFLNKKINYWWILLMVGQLVLAYIVFSFAISPCVDTLYIV